MAFKVPKRVINILDKKISDQFDRIKAKFLGRDFKDRELSLPGMYEAAARHEGGIPNLETLATVSDTASNYITALKLSTINRVTKAVEEGANNPDKLDSLVEDVWKEATSKLKTIVESEIQSTKNTALLDGIVRTNAAFDVEDPLVAFIIVRDGEVCNECTRLHLNDEGTPRVYKLSELNRGYHKRGMEVASVHGLHPNCRCQMITLLPGYGFGENGRVKYISKDHNEYDKQNN